MTMDCSSSVLVEVLRAVPSRSLQESVANPVQSLPQWGRFRVVLLAVEQLHLHSAAGTVNVMNNIMDYIVKYIIMVSQ